MKAIKPVKVSNGSFMFCKSMIAIILWLSFIFKNEYLLYLSFFILLFSSILKVQKAPLVWVYTHTVEKVFKSKPIILDENAIKFAHTAGTILTFICILAVATIPSRNIWYVVLAVALLKTSGAFGYCSALKLYTCMSSDDCCKVTKTITKKLRRPS